nr:MAG: RNA-dependent RNA polymerase [Longquan rodent bunyavirus 4]
MKQEGFVARALQEFDNADTLPEQATVFDDINRAYKERPSEETGYLFREIGYKFRHNIFLHELASFLEIRETSDVTVSYIEEMLIRHTGIDTREFDSHINVTPDLADIYNGKLYLIDAKVRNIYYADLQQTYDKYYKNYIGLARKYGLDLVVMIVILDPNLGSIICYPDKDHKFMIPEKSVECLKIVCQNKYSSVFDMITTTARAIDEEYRLSKRYQELLRIYHKEADKTAEPWFNLKNPNELFNSIKKSKEFQEFMSIFTEEQKKDFINDVLQYNIIDPENQEYYDMRYLQIMTRFNISNDHYMGKLWKESVKMVGGNMKEWNFMTPTGEKLKAAFKERELISNEKYKTIGSVPDLKPSCHFIWTPNTIRYERSPTLKGVENDYKLAKFVSACKSAIRLSKPSRENKLQFGAHCLLKVIADTCDITEDISKYTMTVNELRQESSNKLVSEVFGTKTCTFSKNTTFKVSNSDGKTGMHEWCRAGKGYKKIKQMNSDELWQYLSKKAKIIDLLNEPLKHALLTKWDTLSRKLADQYEDAQVSMHQLDYFLDHSSLESCSKEMNQYIISAKKTVASAILKDISLLMKNAVATSGMSSRGTIKFYFCKNVNIMLVALPTNGILRKQSQLVYSFITISKTIGDVYNYNGEENIALIQNVDFFDYFEQKYTHGWLAVSKPFRLDKSRLMHLLKSYEQFLLLFSIQSHLLVKSKDKGQIYDEEQETQWFNQAVSLSFHAACNITKSATTITDASRYIVNNCIADYSNAYAYITEKFDPKPKTLFSYILYQRLKQGCYRLNSESKYLQIRQIRFRESDMINAGIDTCHIRGVFNPYLVCTSFIDVIIENQTFFYSCLKELHNPAHNLIKLYKTPLEYEKEFRNLWQNTQDKTEFTTGKNDFSIMYDTVYGALANTYASFGESLYQTRREVFRKEGFGQPPIMVRTLTSAKSCVKDRDLNIPMYQDLFYIKSLKSEDEVLNAITLFNKKYKTHYIYDESLGELSLSKKSIDRTCVPLKVSDYKPVESNRVFDELSRLLDNSDEILDEINKYYEEPLNSVDDLRTIDLLFWAIMQGEEKLNFTVFAKGQRTADDREIYQGTMINKLGLYFIEHTFKHLCQIHPDEMISEGGDRKIFKMNAVRKQCYSKIRDLREQQLEEASELHERLFRIKHDDLPCTSRGIRKEEKLAGFRQTISDIVTAEYREKAESAQLRNIVEESEELAESVSSLSVKDYYRKGVTQLPIDEKSILCLLEINADQSKWSAKDLVYKFLIAISLNPGLFAIEKLLMIKFLLSYTKKSLIITDEVMAILKNQIYIDDIFSTSENIFHQMTNNLQQNYVQITQNWLQGNYNYLSSFVHTTAMHTFSKRMELTLNSEWGALYFKSYSMVHSDDNNTATVWKAEKDSILYSLMLQGKFGWFLMKSFSETLKEFCIHLNEKKTNVSRLVKEFISQYNIAGEQCSPWQRIVLPILADSNFISAMEDIYGLCGHIQEAICQNAPPSIVCLLRSIMHSYIYGAYGLGYEMTNDPTKILNVDRRWVPIQLGGTIDVPSYLLAIYGPASNDPWKLKTILVNLYKRMKQTTGVLSSPEGVFQKVQNLNPELLRLLTEDEKFFLKFHVYFDPVNKLDVDIEDSVQVIDPDSLRPKVLLRPRSYITGKYLSRFYTMRLYQRMAESGEIPRFILENPELTFCKPNLNSLFPQWNALKFTNANFVQSLSLQVRSQLFLDRIIHSKSNTIKESFIEDYMAKQIMDLNLEENVLSTAHLTYNQAFTKIKDIIENIHIDVQAVKDLFTSALLSNKYLQILLEIDDCLIKEDVVKNTSNYIIKFKTLFHAHETINPPTKIVKYSLYPCRKIYEYELLFKTYLETEKNHLLEYLSKTKPYKTYRAIFDQTYSDAETLVESLNVLQKRYPNDVLVKTISKLNDLAFNYLTMYSYRQKMVVLKSYCPGNHLFINYLIGSNLIDNAFVNISLNNQLVYRKNLEISTAIVGIPTIHILCSIFYSYFNFIESCIKAEYRAKLIEQSLQYLQYKDYNVVNEIRYNKEPTNQNDKRLCLLFMHFFGVKLNDEEIKFAEAYLNGESNVVASWDIEHIQRANRIGKFDVTYKTKNIIARVIGLNKFIDTFVIIAESEAMLQSEIGQYNLNRIFRKIVNDLDYDYEFWAQLPAHSRLEKNSLYLKKSKHRCEIIRSHRQYATTSKDMAAFKFICPVSYKYNPELKALRYSIHDVQYFVKPETDLFDVSPQEIVSVVRLRVGTELEGYNLRIRRKEYKKLANISFNVPLYLGHIKWKEFVTCSSLLSSLDTGSGQLNCGDIFKTIIDYQHQPQTTDVIMCPSIYPGAFQDQSLLDIILDSTEKLAELSSDLEIPDYDGSSYSIVTFPFGAPIALHSHVTQTVNEILDFLYSFGLVISSKHISPETYMKYKRVEPKNFYKSLARISSIIKMLEPLLDNGLRSSVTYLYHAIVYISYKFKMYNSVKEEFNTLMRTYNYPVVGHDVEYDESALNFMKVKMIAYNALEDSEKMIQYKKVLDGLIRTIADFQEQRRQFLEINQIMRQYGDTEEAPEPEEEDF